MATESPDENRLWVPGVAADTSMVAGPQSPQILERGRPMVRVPPQVTTCVFSRCPDPRSLAIAVAVEVSSEASGSAGVRLMTCPADTVSGPWLDQHANAESWPAGSRMAGTYSQSATRRPSLGIACGRAGLMVPAPCAWWRTWLWGCA